jgi:hypothetical protein
MFLLLWSIRHKSERQMIICLSLLAQFNLYHAAVYKTLDGSRYT